MFLKTNLSKQDDFSSDDDENRLSPGGKAQNDSKPGPSKKPLKNSTVQNVESATDLTSNEDFKTPRRPYKRKRARL